MRRRTARRPCACASNRNPGPSGRRNSRLRKSNGSKRGPSMNYNHVGFIALPAYGFALSSATMSPSSIVGRRQCSSQASNVCACNRHVPRRAANACRPPIGNRAKLPRSRSAAIHRIGLAKLTPNRRAAARQLMPSSPTAATTRLRKSPTKNPSRANSDSAHFKNWISKPLGIPDDPTRADTLARPKQSSEPPRSAFSPARMRR